MPPGASTRLYAVTRPMAADDTERELQNLREENMRLRVGLEQALLFVEEMATGLNEQSEAEVIAAALRDALDARGDEHRT